MLQRVNLEDRFSMGGKETTYKPVISDSRLLIAELSQGYEFSEFIELANWLRDDATRKAFQNVEERDAALILFRYMDATGFSIIESYHRLCADVDLQAFPAWTAVRNRRFPMWVRYWSLQSELRAARLALMAFRDQCLEYATSFQCVDSYERVSDGKGALLDVTVKGTEPIATVRNKPASKAGDVVTMACDPVTVPTASKRRLRDVVKGTPETWFKASMLSKTFCDAETAKRFESKEIALLRRVKSLERRLKEHKAAMIVLKDEKLAPVIKEEKKASNRKKFAKYVSDPEKKKLHAERQKARRAAQKAERIAKGEVVKKGRPKKVDITESERLAVQAEIEALNTELYSTPLVGEGAYLQN